MVLSLPWLQIKSIIVAYLSNEQNLDFLLSPSLGAIVISSQSPRPKFCFHIHIYAAVEENKYVVDFQRESGDIFAVKRQVDAILDMFLGNENSIANQECDAKDSSMRFYLNEEEEEIKEER
jgi:hypothetical protein